MKLTSLQIHHRLIVLVAWGVTLGVLVSIAVVF